MQFTSTSSSDCSCTMQTAKGHVNTTKKTRLLIVAIWPFLTIWIVRPTSEFLSQLIFVVTNVRNTVRVQHCTVYTGTHTHTHTRYVYTPKVYRNLGNFRSGKIFVQLEMCEILTYEFFSNTNPYYGKFSYSSLCTKIFQD